MFTWANNLPVKYYQIKDEILYAILQIGIDLNKFDFDLFILFLKSPKEQLSNFNERS